MNGKMPFDHKRRVARLRGQSAFERGVGLCGNPYSMPELRTEWHDAWVATKTRDEGGVQEWQRAKVRP